MLTGRSLLVLGTVSLLLVVAACGGGDRDDAVQGAAVIRNAATLSPDGVAIQYATGGHGPAVVLIHCWCGSSALWGETAAELVRDYTVVMLDLAGHGRSGRERRDYTMTAFAGDVLAAMDAAGVRAAVLVGHSMGGPVALEVARLAPDRVLGIVGIDNLEVVESPWTEEQYEEFLAPLRADFPTAAARFLAAMFPADADSALVAQTIGRLTAAPPAMAISAIEHLFSYDLPGAARAYRGPLYLINNDGYPVNVEQWQAYGVELHVTLMHDVGHFPMLTRPAPFRENLRRALAAIAAPEPAAAN